MNRINTLCENLKLKNNEAVVLHSPTNMYYMSLYRGEGLVLVSNSLKNIITDFRYVEEAENESPDFSVSMVDRVVGHNALLANLLKDNNINRLYFEDTFISLADFNSLKDALDGVELIPLGETLAVQRQIKDSQELEYMSKACQITVESLMELLKYIKEGVTEKELAARLEYIMKTKGAVEFAFSTICAAGPNGSLPHAVPSDYKVKKGDMITFDFGAKWMGYCADMTRTVALGTPSDAMLNIYNIVKEAQAKGREALKPGVVCKDVDKVAREYISSKGYGEYFGHGLGHSVGIDIHESPYLNQRCDSIVKVNNILTVEPGIYVPGLGGVRIEDSCVVTEDGNIALTELTRDLIIL